MLEKLIAVAKRHCDGNSHNTYSKKIILVFSITLRTINLVFCNELSGKDQLGISDLLIKFNLF